MGNVYSSASVTRNARYVLLGTVSSSFVIQKNMFVISYWIKSPQRVRRQCVHMYTMQGSQPQFLTRLSWLS